MAYAITSELQRETSVGSMLIETLASSLAARLVQNHVGTLARDVSARATQAGLDRRRLTRVLDYIGANLEGDLILARLALIACLSRFHFSRAFKAAVGRSPHHYAIERYQQPVPRPAAVKTVLLDDAFPRTETCRGFPSGRLRVRGEI